MRAEDEGLKQTVSPWVSSRVAVRGNVEDVLVGMWAFVLVVVLWMAAHHWNGIALLSNHDAGIVLLQIENVLRHGGSWQRGVYSTAMMGGASIPATMGSPPLFHLGALLGLEGPDVYNLAVLLTQCLWAVLGTRAAFTLAQSWHPTTDSVAWTQSLRWRAMLVPLFAFAPVLGWRLSYGHLNTAWGMTAVLAAVTLVVEARHGQLAVTTTLAALLAFVCALQSHSFQILLYGVILGGPLLLLVGLLSSGSSGKAPQERETTGPRWRVFLPLLAVGGVALGLSASVLATMVKYLLSSDTIRRPEATITYDYVTGQFRDWVSSLAWCHSLLPSGRPQGLWHEIHYAFGPPLLLLVLIPRRKAGVLALATLLTLAVAILFASRVWPVAQAMELVPLVKAFRVPERAVLPPAVLLLTLAGAVSVHLAREARPNLRTLALGALLWTGAAGLQPRHAEVLAWLLVVATVVGALRVPTSPTVSGAPIAPGSALPGRWQSAFSLLASQLPWGLSVLSAVAFGDRLLPFVPRVTLDAERKELATELVSHAPALQEPLSRLHGNLNLPLFGLNSAMALNLHGLDGYGYPPRRFFELARVLGGESNAFSTLVHIPLRADSFSSWHLLYNVKAALQPGPNGPTLVTLSNTLGPAWFARAVEEIDSFATLASRLKRPEEELRSMLTTTAYHIATDPIPAMSPGHAGSCMGGTVGRFAAPEGTGTFDIAVTVEGTCPLIVSTNYSELLIALVEEGDHPGSRLETFPVNGSLLGIHVPSGARTIRVLPRLLAP